MNVFDVTGRRVLVSRGSAQKLRPGLVEAVLQRPDFIELDFGGVSGVAPSFVDELLRIVAELSTGPDTEIVIEHPPTRLSSKFMAVGRSHGLVFSEAADGSWRLQKAQIQDSGVS